MKIDPPMLFSKVWLKMHEPDSFFVKESALLDSEIKGFF